MFQPIFARLASGTLTTLLLDALTLRLVWGGAGDDGGERR
jgi:hypothetical protein